MPVINGIEANERAKETPIGFDHPVAKQVSAFRQTLFNFIERVEKFFARNVISPLTRGETGPVNSVVDVVVKKIGELAVFGFDVLREKVDVVFFANSLKTLLNMGQMSSSQLFTIFFVFLSQSAGTVTRSLKFGSVVV